jgi:hypothetical protein
MPRREIIYREESDGLRAHEVEIHTYRARTFDGRETLLDKPSWFDARDAARIALQTYDILVEQVDSL